MYSCCYFQCVDLMKLQLTAAAHPIRQGPFFTFVLNLIYSPGCLNLQFCLSFWNAEITRVHTHLYADDLGI